MLFRVDSDLESSDELGNEMPSPTREIIDHRDYSVSQSAYGDLIIPHMFYDLMH